jgi:hypothetical protein
MKATTRNLALILGALILVILLSPVVMGALMGPGMMSGMMGGSGMSGWTWGLLLALDSLRMVATVAALVVGAVLIARTLTQRPS